MPIRGGTDIAFLGSLVRCILENDRDFREYVRHYTNAPVIIKDGYEDPDVLDGLFSGWNAEAELYSIDTWGYAGTSAETAAGKTIRAADVSGDRPTARTG